MKIATKNILAVLLIAAFAVFAGCSKSSLNNGGQPLGYLPNCLPPSCYSPYSWNNQVYPTPTPFTTGGSATLNVVNNNVGLLSQYVGTPVNQPGPITVNVSLTPSGSVFTGSLGIRFTDGAYLHNGNFSTGSNTDPRKNFSTLTADSSGRPTYRIFFEDAMGAIIVTMTPSGGGTDTTVPGLDGQVYFRNFNTTAPNPLFQPYFDGFNYWPANPDAYCWTITLGAYDCRNFSVPPDTGGKVGFTLLGTFNGMDRHSALGN